MTEHDAADQEHLWQVARAELVARPPEHHEGDDVLRPVQRASTALVELLAAAAAAEPTVTLGGARFALKRPPIRTQRIPFGQSPSPRRYTPYQARSNKDCGANADRIQRDCFGKNSLRLPVPGLRSQLCPLIEIHKADLSIVNATAGNKGTRSPLQRSAALTQWITLRRRLSAENKERITEEALTPDVRVSRYPRPFSRRRRRQRRLRSRPSPTKIAARYWHLGCVHGADPKTCTGAEPSLTWSVCI
jgi:hypothetical protein